MFEESNLNPGIPKLDPQFLKKILSAMNTKKIGTHDFMIDRTLLVKQAPYNISTEEVQKVFSQFATIKNGMLMKPMMEETATAYLEYETPEYMRMTKDKLQGISLNGNKLKLMTFPEQIQQNSKCHLEIFSAMKPAERKKFLQENKPKYNKDFDLSKSMTSFCSKDKRRSTRIKNTTDRNIRKQKTQEEENLQQKKETKITKRIKKHKK